MSCVLARPFNWKFTATDLTSGGTISFSRLRYGGSAHSFGSCSWRFWGDQEIIHGIPQSVARAEQVVMPDARKTD